ncbi:MAG: TlpA disulfide reductase family protein [Candidatus Aminicenantaceae bacterium]
MKKALILLSVLGFIIFGYLFSEEAIPGQTETKAPDFSLITLDGDEISYSDYKGKVLFLNFWATWCGPCQVEIPDFIEVYDKLKKEGMEILGVSLDRAGIEKVKKFVEEYRMNYPVAMANQKIMNDYKPGRFIPTTIIIDRNGIIKHKHVGVMNKSLLIKYFNEFSETH